MAEPTGVVDRDILLAIYRRAMLVNRTDARLRALLQSGQLRFAYYPVRGQEVVSAAAMTALQPTDYLVTTYRGLHDQLSKGIPLEALWAEFAGRATGTCKGKGGPMHITHPRSGVMVTTGIVGSGLPIANGLAISSQNRADGRVTLASFGDGASNIGAFHEALNLASVWKLPIVFLCQNNRYGEHTAYATSTGAERIVDRAVAYGMKGVRVDGNDAAAMYSVARDAVERARAGAGPTLIEAMTYRMLGHFFGAPFDYVPKDLIAQAQAEDPIPALRERLLQMRCDSVELDAIVTDIEAQIDTAVAFALDSPLPDVREIRRDVMKQEAAV